ncbi:MAG: hypothetical protein ACKO7B_01750, partial [Flavobacteriales bacterium]
AVAAQSKSQKDFVSLFVDEFQALDPNAKLAAIFATKELSDRINFNSSNQEVKTVIQTEANAAFDRTYQIIKTRIDKFGVTQPNVQKLGNGRILVELPGIKEPERVRKLLQGTAKLEFWETYDNMDIYPKLEDANTVLKSLVTAMPSTDSVALDSMAVRNDTIKSADATADTAAKSLTQQLASNQTDTAKKDTSAAQKTFEDFARENPLFGVLTPSINQNAQGQSELRKGPVIGAALVKDTAKINAYFAMDQVRSKFPKDFKPLWSVKPID